MPNRIICLENPNTDLPESPKRLIIERLTVLTGAVLLRWINAEIHIVTGRGNLTTEAGFVPGRKFKWACPKEAVIKQSDRDGEIVANNNVARNMLPNGWDQHVLAALNQKGPPIFVQPVTPLNWLEYGPGKTKEAPLNNADILTGPMSGCLLAIWTDNNNAGCAAHIGTTSDADVDEPPNATVKQQFYAMLGLLQKPNSVKGFSPLRAWSDSDLNGLLQIKPSGTGVPTLFGLMTAQKNFFSLALAKYSGVDEWVCLGVKRCQGLDYAGLRAALSPPVPPRGN